MAMDLLAIDLGKRSFRIYGVEPDGIIISWKVMTVVYADRFIPGSERTRAEEAGEEPEAIPFLKRFTVFNADQCADLPAEASAAAPPPPPENLSGARSSPAARDFSGIP